MFFNPIIDGRKTFEVRYNDRDFQARDFIALNEVNDEGNYTGRCCICLIDYVLNDENFVKEGYVILTITPCSINYHRNPEQPSLYRDFRTGLPL